MTAHFPALHETPAGNGPARTSQAESVGQGGPVLGFGAEQDGGAHTSVLPASPIARAHRAVSSSVALPSSNSSPWVHHV